jgi:DNA-binding protein HU-beta
MAVKKMAAKPAAKSAAKAKAAPAAWNGAKSVTPAPAAKPATPPNVTLKHIAAQIAEAHAIPKKEAEAMMDGIIGLMVAHLKAGDRLRLGGFGILEVKNRPARTGRNPATGAAIQIAASKKIAFRPAKELKASI